MFKSSIVLLRISFVRFVELQDIVAKLLAVFLDGIAIDFDWHCEKTQTDDARREDYVSPLHGKSMIAAADTAVRRQCV